MSEMFDRLAKTVALGTSRRDALKYLGGFLTGGFLFGFTGKANADAPVDGDNGKKTAAILALCQKHCLACERKGQPTYAQCVKACLACRKQKGKLCGHCSRTNSVVTCCLGGAKCCHPRQGSTGTSYCANVSSDAKNCGACGNVCTPVNGIPTACCNGKCVPLNTNTNCGACGKTCSPGKTCTGQPNAAGVIVYAC